MLGIFGQINCSQRLQKVAQSPKNRQRWSHWFPAHISLTRAYPREQGAITRATWAVILLKIRLKQLRRSQVRVDNCNVFLQPFTIFESDSSCLCPLEIRSWLSRLKSSRLNFLLLESGSRRIGARSRIVFGDLESTMPKNMSPVSVDPSLKITSTFVGKIV